MRHFQRWTPKWGAGGGTFLAPGLFFAVPQEPPATHTLDAWRGRRIFYVEVCQESWHHKSSIRNLQVHIRAWVLPGSEKNRGRAKRGPKILVYMGKCQTDPTPKDYEMVVALRWWLGVSPAALSPGVFVPSGRDFDKSGFIS